MNDIKTKLENLRLMHWSTYVAFAVWGTAGFMSQPTFSAFLVHFFLTPALLCLLIYAAHHEGYNS